MYRVFSILLSISFSGQSFAESGSICLSEDSEPYTLIQFDLQIQKAPQSGCLDSDCRYYLDYGNRGLELRYSPNLRGKAYDKKSDLLLGVWSQKKSDFRFYNGRLFLLPTTELKKIFQFFFTDAVSKQLVHFFLKKAEFKDPQLKNITIDFRENQTQDEVGFLNCTQRQIERTENFSLLIEKGAWFCEQTGISLLGCAEYRIQWKKFIGL